MAIVAVIVAIIQEGKVLLTRREDFEVWCLPGGGVEEGESVAEAAIREAREETGIEIELTRLVGVYSRIGGMDHDVHAVLFAAKPVGGTLKLQPGETIEVRYFPFEEIPNELLFGHKKRIQDAIHEVSGVAVKQELKMPLGIRPTRQELYQLRDQSGMSRKEFYIHLMGQAEVTDVVEVGQG